MQGLRNEMLMSSGRSREACDGCAAGRARSLTPSRVVSSTHNRVQVSEHSPCETSRTVIRAASLRLLPDVHARSIYQLFSLEP